MLKKLVLDLETQYLFQDVGGRGNNHLLKVSVCGVYDSVLDQYRIYKEADMDELAVKLQESDLIIGFNIKGFDFEVLQPYMYFDINKLPYYDILEEIDKVLGRRVNLESVATATLGYGKSGKGTDAVVFWREGRMAELEKYCLDDVKVTKEVYDYILANQKVLYLDYFGKTNEIPLKLEEKESENKNFQQILF